MMFSFLYGDNNVISCIDLHTKDETLIARKKSKPGLYSLSTVSCLRPHLTDLNLFAAGSFNGYIGIYDIRSHEGISYFMSPSHSGVTHIALHPSEPYLYHMNRTANAWYTWDLRHLNYPLTEISVEAETNQRLGFSLSRDGRQILVGDKKGLVTLYNAKEMLPLVQFSHSSSSVSSCRFLDSSSHILTTYGSREFDFDDQSENDDNNDSCGGNNMNDFSYNCRKIVATHLE